MKSRNPLSELILRIHSATHDQAAWERVLKDISDLGMGESLAIGRVHYNTDRPEVVSAARFPEEFFQLIDTFKNPSEDFGIQSMKSIKCGEILTPSQMFDKKSFEQSRMYQDVCRKVDSYPCYIRRLFLGEKDLYAFMANHEEKLTTIGRDHKSVLEMIVDHVELALKNLSKMEVLYSHRNPSIELINHLNIGIVLLNRNEEILFMNQYAETILSKSDGLAVRRGKLEAARHDETSKLYRLVGQALSISNGQPHLERIESAMQISRRSLARNYSVIVAPLLITSGLGIGRARPLASVFISDPEETVRMSQVKVLRDLYDLTPTEAKVAVEMVKGHGMQSVADSVQLSLSTVKTHQRGIFQKLDVKSQAELVRYIYGSVAILSHEEE